MPANESLPHTGLEAFPQLRDELDRCMKCGFCMSVCPVYGAEKSEGAVARSESRKRCCPAISRSTTRR